MKLGLINSAWAQSGRDTAFGIRNTREIGFDTIDIFADPLDTDARERRLIRRECEKAGLPLLGRRDDLPPPDVLAQHQQHVAGVELVGEVEVAAAAVEVEPLDARVEVH